MKSGNRYIQPGLSLEALTVIKKRPRLFLAFIALASLLIPSCVAATAQPTSIPMPVMPPSTSDLKNLCFEGSQDNCIEVWSHIGNQELIAKQINLVPGQPGLIGLTFTPDGNCALGPVQVNSDLGQEKIDKLQIKDQIEGTLAACNDLTADRNFSDLPVSTKQLLINGGAIAKAVQKSDAYATLPGAGIPKGEIPGLKSIGDPLTAIDCHLIDETVAFFGRDVTEPDAEALSLLLNKGSCTWVIETLSAP